MYASSNQSVARALFSIVPSNTVNNTRTARTVYVGGAGDISFVDAEGNATLLKAVPQGTWVPAECLRVNVTGTTATLLVGCV